ncbi:hypothetical protein PLICRDRAFT_95456 [Plicaturopsis crispa FD-325 SS-3]|uniref:Peptide hydrolase n=1 Tax=Plicaturopsis crispa FD-325 SS-3 TaxID=944288 RepID=A0A0C9T7C9_PLICR|nr:hypothetical protein PLICRDRAFT_95456 [Plicaturopsis crispa FD-325 SS-3]
MLPPTFLLVTPFSPSLFAAEDSCLSKTFYGNYGGQAVFLPDAVCFDAHSSQFASGSVVPLDGAQQLVWVQHKAVEQSLKDNAKDESNLDLLFDRLSAPPAADANQEVFAPSEYEVLHRTETAALLSVSSAAARTIDTLLPRFWKSTLLPTSPVPFLPVPAPAVDRVKELLQTFKFDPVVASIVNNISVSQMRKDIRWLTGEDGVSGIVSRHSFSEGSRTAAAWLKDQFEETGAACELKPFLIGFAPNVVCRYPATENTTATVLLSAHYDSRGSFGSTRAPGGDDDGSGTVSLLGIARTIKRKGLTFRSNVELVAFAGEEQGLYGSKGYSRELREAGANITVMIQADMLAYHAPGEPAQLGLPATIGTTEVTQLVANASAIYSPELKVGFTSACCSDHQSFHEQGFPATQVFERAGPIVDPFYHNSGDLSERDGYDLEQVKSIAKVQFATLLHAAGFDTPH